MTEEVYIAELIGEREALDVKSHCFRLVGEEIAKIRSRNLRPPPGHRENIGQDDIQSRGGGPVFSMGCTGGDGGGDGADVIKLSEKVMIPARENPQVNFVGKLLGQGGKTMQRLQASTQSRMSVFGRGSMKDKNREEDLRNGDDPKYHHLREDLHVQIVVKAPFAMARKRMEKALTIVKLYLEPKNFSIDDAEMRMLEDDVFNDDNDAPAVNRIGNAPQQQYADASSDRYDQFRHTYTPAYEGYPAIALAEKPSFQHSYTQHVQYPGGAATNGGGGGGGGVKRKTDTPPLAAAPPESSRSRKFRDDSPPARQTFKS